MTNPIHRPKKILISGGNGILATNLCWANKRHTIHAWGRDCMDVTKLEDVNKAVQDLEPDIFIHCAAMTTPMSMHDTIPAYSLNANVIGTTNVAMSCTHYGVRLVYISTDYVYPGTDGPYYETHKLKPINTYAKTKLAGEYAVSTVPDHLILRCAHTIRPFKHERAFTDSFKSYLYVDEIAPLILKLIEAKPHYTVVNVGGKKQSVFDFAKQSCPDIIPISRLDVEDFVPEDTSMQLTRMNRMLRQ